MRCLVYRATGALIPIFHVVQKYIACRCCCFICALTFGILSFSATLLSIPISAERPCTAAIN